MLRLVRIILLATLLVGTIPSMESTSFTSVPQANAACSSVWIFNCQDDTQVPVCNSNDPNSSKYCSLDKGTDIVKNGVHDIKTDRKFSQYVQDVVAYLLSFLTIICVLLLLWAGFTILTSGGDTDKVKGAKSTIMYVVLGLVVIFLAYSIVRFILGSADPSKRDGLIKAFNFIETTYAAADDSRGFDYYRTRIENLAQGIGRQYEVDGKVKAASLQELQDVINASMDTFPDASKEFNTSLANQVSTAISLVRKYPDSDVYTDRLASSLKDYITNIRVGTITATITATPDSGNAPLVVTLRASDAKDPSGVRIPDQNFVWWLKGAGGTRQVLGRGASIGYTFKEEGVYSVNLDIISASRNSKGRPDVISFAGSKEIKVLPKLGNILLFVNGQNTTNVDTVKVTPAQGRAGLILDATSSTAARGASIIRSEWNFGNGNYATYDGTPRLERQFYASEGVYSLKFKIRTNEGAEVTKELRLLVQSPIATIRSDKVSGFAGEDFKFLASTNVGGVLLNYEWSVLEADSGKSLYTAKTPSISYRFPRTGMYLVKLKTQSSNGQEDTDNLQIQIDSRVPVAQFDAKAASGETPNTIAIDATKSYDPDSMESSTLIFNWTIDGERVELDNSSRNGAIGAYTFTTKGEHTIVLELSNPQGKVTTAQKKINVESLLSVKLITTPKIAELGKPVALVAESQQATVFEWTYGDGETENTSEARAFHTYKKSGIYDVRLTVQGDAQAGASNTISRKVYVTDAETPFALISVKRDQDTVEPVANACPSGDAYVIDRTKAVRITGEDSTNTDGSTNGLTYTWKYQGKSSTQKDFSYKFDELGCFPVGLTVRSQKTGKTSSMTTYVKVENLEPTFAGITVTSPKLEADPVIVNVSVDNAVDPDGVIVSYLWYYYTDSDPEPQDFRITKTPKTSFVLPRTNGKYFFAVTLEDSNGAKVNSDTAREERYSITLAADNINTPIIGLKTSTSTANVGQSVSFQANVKNVIGQDLSDKSEYKWDFDGDGFYDETTTSPSVTHTYQNPGSYNMKVKASYRGISNTRYQQITVRNEIVPNLEYFAIGSRYVFMNTTSGMFTSVKWKAGDATSENRDSYVATFAEDEVPSEVTLTVSDGTDTKTITVPLRKDKINAARINAQKEPIVLLSYPKAEEGVIHVSSANDKVYLYLGESKGADRYGIDIDTTSDSDLNGSPDDDIDNKGTDSYTSGAPFNLRTLGDMKERSMKVTLYDASGKAFATAPIKLVLDYLDESTMKKQLEGTGSTEGYSDADKKGLETLKDLIRTKAPEADRVKLMSELSLIQDNWNDTVEKTKAILAMERTVSELSVKDEVKQEFLTVLDGFLLSESEAKDDISLAVNVLKKLIPTSNPHYEEMFGKDGNGGLIAEILGHPTNAELNKQIGEKILSYIKDDANITDQDKLTLKEQLRVIINGGSTATTVPAQTEESTGTLATIGSLLLSVVKVFGIVIGLVILLFIALFVFFKITNKNDTMGFQDFLIEKIFHKAPPKPKAPVTDPFANLSKTGVPEGEAEKKEDIIKKDEPLTEASQDFTLRESPVDSSVSYHVTKTPKTQEKTEAPKEEEKGAEIPDWLKGTTEKLVQSTMPSAEEQEEAPKEEEKGAEIPDWLKGAEVSEAKPEEKETPEATESSPAEVPDWLKGTIPAEPTKETPTTEEGTQDNASVELPDWLKGTTPVTETEEEAKAEKPEEAPSEPLSTEETFKKDEKNFAEPAPAGDLPDWLRDIAPKQETGEKPVQKTEQEPKEEPKQEKQEEEKKATEKKPKVPKKPMPKKEDSSMDLPPSVSPDDLPDWLK